MESIHCIVVIGLNAGEQFSEQFGLTVRPVRESSQFR